MYKLCGLEVNIMLLDDYVLSNPELNDFPCSELSVEKLNTEVANYRFVEPSDFKASGAWYYNERLVNKLEFQTEIIFAMLLKFSTEVTWPQLQIDLTQSDVLSQKLLEAGFKQEGVDIFKNYQEYWELILADQTTKTFTIKNNSQISEDEYRQIFGDLSDLFFSVLQQDGYVVYPNESYNFSKQKENNYIN